MMTQFEHAYVLNVMSDDHPGIVDAVSNAVEMLGGNIDSCSQTVLGGYFTLIMIVSLPEPVEPHELADRIRGSESVDSGYQVTARAAMLADDFLPAHTRISDVPSASAVSRTVSKGAGSSCPTR